MSYDKKIDKKIDNTNNRNNTNNTNNYAYSTSHPIQMWCLDMCIKSI